VKFSYTSGQDSPDRPCVSIELTDPDDTGHNVLLCGVLLDTGSCLTVLPLSVLDELNCKQVGTCTVESFSQERSKLDMYLVTIKLCNYSRICQVAAGSENVAILGRDLLNERRVELDGVRSVLTVYPVGA
jgi:predicted aspartyl protease